MPRTPSRARRGAGEPAAREPLAGPGIAGTTDTAVPASIVGLRLDQDHVVIAAGVSADRIAWLRHALAAEFPDVRDVVSEGYLLRRSPSRRG